VKLTVAAQWVVGVGVLYPCWRSNLSPSRSLVSKSSSVHLLDVGLFGSKEMLCLLLLHGVVSSWIRSVLTVGPYTALYTSISVFFLCHMIGLTYTLCGFTRLGLCPPIFFYFFFLFYNKICEHLTRTGICKTSQLSWNVFYSFFMSLCSWFIK